MTRIRKTLLYLGLIALTISAVQPALAFHNTGITATVNTDSGVNLKLHVAPDGNSRVLELIPSGTALQVIGLTVRDSITVPVPKAGPSSLDNEPATEPIGTPQAASPISSVHPSAQVSPVPVSAQSSSAFLLGFLDTFNPPLCEAGGWALDGDHPISSLVVSIYRDGAPPSPSAVPIGTFATDVSRPDVNVAKHATGTHGFLVQFGANSGMYDGQAHRIYAVAVGANGATTSLNASGAPLTCTGAAPQTGSLIDQMWLYVNHAVNGGSLRGWVNARYVDLTDAKNNKLALPSDRKTLPVTDPTTPGMAIGVAAPGINDNSGVSQVSDIKTAKNVIAAIDYGTHLAIHLHPYLSSHVIGFVDSGTVLTTCGIASDNEKRLWVCVTAPAGANWAGKAQGYALGSMLDTVDSAASVASAQSAPQGDALTAPLQPDAKAQVDNTANTSESQTEPTQVAPQDTPIPSDTPQGQASQQALATPVQIDPPTPAATQAAATGN